MPYDENLATPAGSMVPSLCVAGTLTRRAKDRLWQVAPNADENATGSEIKAMVCVFFILFY